MFNNLFFDEREKHLFLTAVMFYTQIRIPTATPYSPQLLNQSRKYFTSIGLIVGGIACLSYALVSIILPSTIAVLISMIVSILATGAFHEDGFTDTCDALGGGWSSEQILTIMKDSRIGTYGTIGILSMLSLKYLLLVNIAELGAPLFYFCLLAAHTTSRMHSSRLIKHYDYVQDIDQSKVKPIAAAPLSSAAERFSTLVALIPCTVLALYSLTATILALGLGFCVAASFMKYCEKRIGGYTGDVLGAIQQLTEVTFLLACLIVLL